MPTSKVLRGSAKPFLRVIVLGKTSEAAEVETVIDKWFHQLEELRLRTDARIVIVKNHSIPWRACIEVRRGGADALNWLNFWGAVGWCYGEYDA